MSKLFQVYEEDLAELERLVPEISEGLMPYLNPNIRIKLRRIKVILSDLRWNYGPSTEVEIIREDEV